MGEPCATCGVPMVIETGLWYCPECDAYQGEAPDDADDELREYLLGREVCHCGGKIRHGQCRDCGETYESESQS